MGHAPSIVPKQQQRTTKTQKKHKNTNTKKKQGSVLIRSPKTVVPQLRGWCKSGGLFWLGNIEQYGARPPMSLTDAVLLEGKAPPHPLHIHAE